MLGGESDYGRIRSSTDSGPNKRNAERAKLSCERTEPSKQPETLHGSAEPDPDAPKLPPDWRTASWRRKNSIGRRCFLTSWETNFVADLIARGTRWPSPKQAVVILRILEKAGAFGAASADAIGKMSP